MKCPRCGNYNMCKDGMHRGPYSVSQGYKCWKCKKRVSVHISGSKGREYMKTREYRFKMSMAQSRRYKEASPELRKHWADAIRAARAMKPKKSDLKRKDNFIGMLGDIEVYATNFGRVGRSSKSVSSKWAGPAHGKPELKVKKRAVG